jgi:DNA-binding transcriptional ArsR family regulator
VRLQLGKSLICASALAYSEKNMQTLTVKSLKTEIHPQTKVMFWFLFASTRGAATRIRIVKLLQRQPYNANQMSKELSLDYKAVKHHLHTLEKNNLLEKFDANYGATYYLSALFEENFSVFNEIADRMNL